MTVGPTALAALVLGDLGLPLFLDGTHTGIVPPGP